MPEVNWTVVSIQFSSTVSIENLRNIFSIKQFPDVDNIGFRFEYHPVGDRWSVHIWIKEGISMDEICIESFWGSGFEILDIRINKYVGPWDIHEEVE